MQKRAGMVLAVCLLMGSMLACNLPLFGAEAAGTSVPNLTLTALYAPQAEESLTPTVPLVVTATQEPTVPATETPTPTAIPPTETASPTATSTTAPAATGLPQRSAGSVSAAYLSSAPTIDGDWGEWTSAAYPMRSVVFGAGSWQNADDLEGSYRIGWDSTYLYIAVKVLDDVYKQGASGADIYKGDSIEILLDTNLYGDFYYNVLSPDDYQLGISPGRPDVNGDREAYLWFPQNIAGSRAFTIGAVQSDGLYRLEAAIPWSLFGVTPYAGQHFGFAISVSDNDDTSQNVQQSMISNIGTRRLTQPTTWGELILK